MISIRDSKISIQSVYFETLDANPDLWFAYDILRLFKTVFNVKTSIKYEYLKSRNQNNETIYYAVLSLQELACRAIVARTTVYGIDQLPLPKSIKSHLKSYAMTTTSQLRYNGNRSLSSSKSLGSHHRKLRFVGVGHNNGGLSTPGSSPGSITDSRTSCVGRNSCTVSWEWQRTEVRVAVTYKNIAQQSAFFLPLSLSVLSRMQTRLQCCFTIHSNYC